MGGFSLLTRGPAAGVEQQLTEQYDGHQASAKASGGEAADNSTGQLAATVSECAGTIAAALGSKTADVQVTAYGKTGDDGYVTLSVRRGTAAPEPASGAERSGSKRGARKSAGKTGRKRTRK